MKSDRSMETADFRRGGRRADQRSGSWRLLLGVIVVACSGDVARRADLSLEEWIRVGAIPLTSTELGAGSEDLEPLGKLLRDARVVAFGEPAHNAHEPLALRNRLFVFLVEEMGFTAIALESGLIGSALLRDYVRGDDVDIDASAPEALSHGFHRFRENRDLLDWMRAYNQDPMHGRKLGIYGIDLPGSTGDHFTHSHARAERVLQYLARVDPRTAQTVRARFGSLLIHLNEEGHARLSLAERDRLSAAIGDLVAVFEQYRFEYEAGSSPEEFAWAYQGSLTLRQLDAWLRTHPLGWTPTPAQPYPPSVHLASAIRDFTMFQNMKWVLEQEGPHGRVLLFAHAGHVQSAPLVVELGGATVSFQPLGQHLRSWLGDELVIIGTAFETSSDSTVYQAHPQSQAAGAVLSRVGVPSFVFDLRRPGLNARGTDWLRANLPSTHRPAPQLGFDLLVFTDTLRGYQPW